MRTLCEEHARRRQAGRNEDPLQWPYIDVVAGEDLKELGSCERKLHVLRSCTVGAIYQHLLHMYYKNRRGGLGFIDPSDRDAVGARLEMARLTWPLAVDVVDNKVVRMPQAFGGAFGVSNVRMIRRQIIVEVFDRLRIVGWPE